jgi:hypothetical protein
MNKVPRARPTSRRAPQMTLAFVSEVPLEERVRTEVLVLMSRLLLQAAQARNQEKEGPDDRS